MHSLALDHQQILTNLLTISRRAGLSILDIYKSDFDIKNKADSTPITSADMASHAVIVGALQNLTPNIPILSEESTDILISGVWRQWNTYWLIDPLDGTREFVNRNGEFTVNIALVHEHQAVLGVIHSPVSGDTYLGTNKLGAFKVPSFDTGFNSTHEIRVRSCISEPAIVVTSRSHSSSKLSMYLSKLNDHQVMTMGSSIKFCLLAEGSADLYPRFSPTSEWDTAAGQVILEAAGGSVIDAEHKPLRYNTKDSTLNPGFLAFGQERNNYAEVYSTV